jgi:hypothetical protein
MAFAYSEPFLHILTPIQGYLGLKQPKGFTNYKKVVQENYSLFKVKMRPEQEPAKTCNYVVTWTILRFKPNNPDLVGPRTQQRGWIIIGLNKGTTVLCNAP